MHGLVRKWRIMLLLAGWLGAGMVLTAAETNAVATTARATNATPGSGTLVLSIETCMALALGSNLEIELGRQRPQSRAEDFFIADEVFTPTFHAQGAYRDQQERATSSQIGAEVLETREQTGDAGVRKTWGAGTRTDLLWAFTRREDNSEFRTLNPSYNSGVRLDVTQPLLRGFGLAVNQADLERALADKRIADSEFEILLESELLGTYRAYWDLVRAASLLELERNSLSLAETQVAIVRDRQSAGAASRLEVTSAEAALARQLETAIIVLRNYRKAGDALLYRIRPSDSIADYDLRLIASSDATPTEGMLQVPDRRAAVDLALATRPELRRQAQQIARADIDVDVARNAKGPDLNLFGHYAYDGVDSTLGGAMDDINQTKYPEWRAGVSLEFLFDRESRKARWRQATLGKQTAELGRRQEAAQIVVEVRAAIFDLEAAIERVAATRRTQALAQEEYEGELERLRVGISTVFQVDTLRRDLLLANRNDLDARLDVIVANAVLEAVRGQFAKQIVTAASARNP